MSLFDFDSAVRCSNNILLLCGVDEAGRGPLAGPVCTAAVIFPDGVYIEGLDDSKKLTEKRREVLFSQIVDAALSYAIAFATEQEIDEINILNATYLAINRAISALDIAPQLSIIDGNRSQGIEAHCQTIVGGDATSASIAAASVLAKVTRDRYMLQMAEIYPEYGFEKHKGYGTKLHYAAIREHGASPIHRITFLRKMH